LRYDDTPDPPPWPIVVAAGDLIDISPLPQRKRWATERILPPMNAERAAAGRPEKDDDDQEKISLRHKSKPHCGGEKLKGA